MTMDNQQNTPEELAALELYHQLANLSDETADRALLLTLRMPNGRYVGDVWLSRQDVEGLTDSSLGLAMVKADHGQQAEPLLDVDANDIADVIAEAESFLTDGGI
ncbi:hypothetical protein [Streptomyces sp. NPDC008092]|uniref:hypothetical protein n=1 Tax=Streptomyces sp. NPDC008092 TaxID=3364808 RepID=UPI0036E6DF24